MKREFFNSLGKKVVWNATKKVVCRTLEKILRVKCDSLLIMEESTDGFPDFALDNFSFPLTDVNFSFRYKKT